MSSSSSSSSRTRTSYTGTIEFENEDEEDTAVVAWKIPQHICPSDWLLRSVEDKEDRTPNVEDAKCSSRRGRRNAFDPLCTYASVRAQCLSAVFERGAQCSSAKRENILFFSHSHNTRTRGIPAPECTLEYL